MIIRYSSGSPHTIPATHQILYSAMAYKITNIHDKLLSILSTDRYLSTHEVVVSFIVKFEQDYNHLTRMHAKANNPPAAWITARLYELYRQGDADISYDEQATLSWKKIKPHAARSITIKVPDSLYSVIINQSAASHQSIESFLVDLLTRTLKSASSSPA